MSANNPNHVINAWNTYKKERPEMVAPILKGMPKTCVEYFVAFFKKHSHGNLEADKRYCVNILNLMGVGDEDANMFFATAIAGQY